ncbi:MAG: heme ABC transporter ATP-binding protein [Pseudolabrys sp.]
MNAVEATSVTVRAGAAVLLDEVSFAAKPGEAIAIAGPNGAGKSTLLRVISGDRKPDRGSVRLRGRPLAGYPSHMLARHRAVLSQSTMIAFPFSVAEVVAMGVPDGHGRMTGALVDAALDEVGLTGFRDRIVTTLSGGEQHRTHLARVLVQLACGEREHGPGVLLLDEPTASLDLHHQIDFVALARKRAAQGTCVVAVLHDLNLAATFADRILMMNRGGIAADGPPPAIITERLLADVFGVTLTMGDLPAAGMPFVLPQTLTVAQRNRL